MTADFHKDISHYVIQPKLALKIQFSLKTITYVSLLILKQFYRHCYMMHC